MHSVREVEREGNFVPLADLQGIEVVDDGQRAELVEAGGDVAVFDIRQAADADDELGAAAQGGEIIAGSFDVAIRQAQSLARLRRREPDSISPSGIREFGKRRDYSRVTILLRIQNTTGRIRGTDADANA